MTATLRVVLDQVVAPADADLAMASRELARALVATAPAGCDVAGLVPAVPAAALETLQATVPGLTEVSRLPLARRELATAWQLGVPSGAGAGLIHAPTLLAPLMRHDRVHDHDQTVVTVWDLDAWEAPGELPRAAVLWRRAMLKRAVRFADAVVVPTHGMGERLSELAPRLADRVRVIAGAAPERFAVPSDEVGRRRALGLPEGCLLLAGSARTSDGLAEGFAAIAASGSDLPVVVIDAPEGSEPAIVDLAAASGVAEHRVHVRGVLDDADRAAVFAGVIALLAPSTATRFPWRVAEALRLGVPVVASASDVHREIIVDGGLLAEPGALAAALADALGSTSAIERLAVLAGDRGKAFSWAGAAERVWQLHADL